MRHAAAGNAVTAPRALTAVAGTATNGSRRAEARRAHSGGTPPGPPTHARTSPLVTTITKIAEVVPLPVKLLLGLLLSLSLALGTRSWLGALRARRLERQRGELLEDVGLLQAALLPQTPERLGIVGTSAAYRPADGPGAGGDFYDVFALGDDRVAVIVGDISGHGRQALPHTALVRFTLRAYLEAGLSPRVAVQTAGSVLERQLGGSFATVVVATYDPHERILVYSCAGHPPPLVVGSWPMESTGWVGSAGPAQSAGLVGSAGSNAAAQSTGLVGSAGSNAAAQSTGLVGSAGSNAAAQSTGLVGSTGAIGSIVPITVCAAPPIGVGMRTGSRQTTLAVPGEARVCFHTDGVTEARVGGELFGARRLTRALAELGPAVSASQLLEQVAEMTDTRNDDMAACVLNIAGEAHAAPEVLREELELDRDSPSAERAEQLLLAGGVPRREIPELIHSARLAAGQAGSAILELFPAEDGPPHVQLRRENVARLPTVLARDQAAVMGARQ